MNCIILAPGESLDSSVAESCRGAGYVIAVCDAFRLAPWCDAIVSTDYAWWRHRPEIGAMTCRKFSTANHPGVEKVEKRASEISSGTNSGLLALHVAVTMLGATDILLVGFDMRGQHFFGRHKEPLKNTTEARFAVFKLQFAQMEPIYKRYGARIVNCTPGSALKVYPFGNLDEELAQWSLCRSAA